MATSKLLKPTNVTISIPEFTDQPDQRVNSNCIDKEADAINTLSEQLENYYKSPTTTTDFNNITSDGIYKFDWTSNGSTYHRPANQGGQLIVCVKDTIKTQIYMTSSTEMFIRGYHDNAWESWKKLGDIASGSWTPVFDRSTVTVSNATYIRVGNLVTAKARLTITASNAQNDYLLISGNAPAPVAGVPIQGEWSANTGKYGVLSSSGSTSVWFTYQGAEYCLNNLGLTTARELYITITYFTAW